MTLCTPSVAERERVPIPPHEPGDPRPFAMGPVLEAALGSWEGSAIAGGGIFHTRVDQAARVLGIDRQMIYRWQRDGLGIYQADAIAIRLGRHPVAIWPDWYAVSCTTGSRDPQHKGGSMTLHRVTLAEDRRAELFRSLYSRHPEDHSLRKELVELDNLIGDLLREAEDFAIARHGQMILAAISGDLVMHEDCAGAQYRPGWARGILRDRG